MSLHLQPKLASVLDFLLGERFIDSPRRARLHAASTARAGTFHQLQLLHQLLSQRPAIPQLPADILRAIDDILLHLRNNKILTSASSIPTSFNIPRHGLKDDPIRVKLWKGDITALANVCAVVNAANSQMLGCFQPLHRCIDNVIHAAAGPGLRAECNTIMAMQGHPEPVGTAKITRGYQLPAKYIIHTVGPSIRQGHTPTTKEERKLAECYYSCLEATEKLLPLEDGSLSIAFCCISTGLFAFPAAIAAKIAIQAIITWCETHPSTPITDIIFDVYTENDLELYQSEIALLGKPRITQPLSPTSVQPVPPPSLQTAKSWIQQADYLIISAGAGLSAGDGLDYTSTALFSRLYPAFTQYGLTCLYDTIGFTDWPSPLVKWGYFFFHASVIRDWPKSPLYNSLLELATRFGDKYFVRTSNADGLFAANGFPENRIATPQGQYRYLQCYDKCRPDAVFEFEDFLDKALPFLDPVTQILTNEELIPKCKYCGEELTLCVRGGSYFNDGPFKRQESAWYKFLDLIEEDEESKVVILELGVGLNTAGVLRWPNEQLAEQGEGQFKLIRGGLGPSACVPADLTDQQVAVAIDGDMKDIVRLLVEDT